VAGLLLGCAALGAEPMPEIVVDGKKLPDLIKQLRSPSENERQRAIGLLVELPTQTPDTVAVAVETLLERSSVDPDLTAVELIRLGRAAVPALTRSLWDENNRKRAVALLALGGLGPSSRPAASAIEQQLASEHPLVRGLAAVALGRIEARSATPAVARLLQDKEQFVRARAATALVALGGPADTLVPRLVEWLKDADVQQRRTAGEVLTLLGREATPAIPGLIPALRDSDKEVRGNALRCLGQIGSAAREAIPALTTLVKDDRQASDRVLAAEVLWAVARSPDAVPALKKAVKETKAREKTEAASVLWRCGKAPEAVTALVEVLENGTEADRLTALEALREIGPGARAALPVLRGLVKDKRPASDFTGLALSRAIIALGRLGDAGQPALAELAELAKSGSATDRYLARVAIARIQPDAAAISSIAEMLREEDASLREDAARLLGEFGPAARSTAPALREALKDKESRVRLAAAAALVKITNDTTVLPVVSALLRDRNPQIQTMAAVELGFRFQAKAKPAVPALIQALWGEAVEVRIPAAEALGRIGPGARAAVPALLAILSDDQQDELHSATAEALGLIGPAASAAVPTLKKRLDHPDPYVRCCAALALWQIAREDAGSVAAKAAVNDRNFRARIVALETLSHLRRDSDEVVTCLIEELRAPEFARPWNASNQRYMAARALGRIGPPAATAVPALRELLTVEDPDLRAEVAEALRRIEEK
jgi:HEAT repeat protein